MNFSFLVLSLFFIGTQYTKVSSKERRAGFHDEYDIWNNLMNTRLLGPFFHSPQKNYYPSANSGITRLSEFPKRSTHNLFLQYLQNNKKIGYKSSIFLDDELDDEDDDDDDQSPKILTFFDDPICEILVFGSGLYVCGEAHITKSLTITSGLNETELFLAKTRLNKALTQTYMDRCLVEPKFSTLNDTRTKRREWCYKEFHVKSAHVYVLDRAEFGGNLITSSLRAEMGTQLYVGLRSIIYSNPRHVGDESTLPLNFLNTSNSFVQNIPSTRRERLSQVAKASIMNSMDILPNNIKESPLPFFQEEEEEDQHQQQGKEKTEEQRNSKEELWNKDSLARQSPSKRNLNLNHDFFLQEEELLSMGCPIIDVVTGSIQHHSRLSQTNPNYQHRDRSLASSRLHNDWPSHLKEKLLESQNPYPIQSPFTKKTDTYFSGSSYDSTSDFSSKSYLPPLPKGIALGDLKIFSGHFIIENGAFAWIYGNLKANKGVVARYGAHLHLHCGHMITNIANGTGLLVTQGSTVSSGGFLESIVPRVLLQSGSTLRIFGSLLVTRYFQASSSSIVEVFKELLASLMSLKEAAKLYIHEALEVETLLDISDGSELSVMGTMGVGYLQVLDGSKLQIQQNASMNASFMPQNEEARQVVVIEDTLLVDCKSSMKVYGVSVLVYSSVFITNVSSLYVDNGDLYLDGEGSIQVVGSKLLARGNCIAPRGSLLVGFGSVIRITGDLQTFGVTLYDEAPHHTKWNFSRNWPESAKSHASVGQENNANKRLSIRPALFIENSEVVVHGSVEILNSWVEISRRSLLKVGGNGLLALQPNKSFVAVRHGSQLLVESGHLVTGKALLVTSGSTVDAQKDTSVISLGNVDVNDRSLLMGSSLRTFGDVYVSGNSKLTLTKSLIVSGVILSITEQSSLNCQDLRQRRGDIFVTNRAKLLVENGSIWAYGSVIAQAGSRIRIRNGTLTAVQGDVVAENNSHLHVEGPLLLFSAYYTKKKMQNLQADLSYEALKDTLPIQSLKKNTSRQGTAIPSMPNEEQHTAFKNLVGSLRRTSDSTLIYSRIIPSDIVEKVYKQHVQLIDTTNTHKNASQSTEIQWATAGTTVIQQQSVLHEKEAFVKQLNHPTTWEALTYFNGKALLPLDDKKNQY